MSWADRFGLDPARVWLNSAHQGAIPKVAAAAAHEAETALRKTIALRAYFPRAYNSLGICLSHQQKFDESYQNFATAVRLMPDYAEAYVNWGLVLANQQRVDDAVAKYKLALEADEHYRPAIDRLAKHYADRKDFASAEPYLRKVAELSPKSPNAWLNLSMVLVQLGKRA